MLYRRPFTLSVGRRVVKAVAVSKCVALSSLRKQNFLLFQWVTEFYFVSMANNTRVFFFFFHNLHQERAAGCAQFCHDKVL